MDKKYRRTNSFRVVSPGVGTFERKIDGSRATFPKYVDGGLVMSDGRFNVVVPIPKISVNGGKDSSIGQNSKEVSTHE